MPSLVGSEMCIRDRVAGCGAGLVAVGLSVSPKLQNITVLGATGSIGVSTLDVIRRHPDRYRAFALCAHSQVDKRRQPLRGCLLYTSDAADDMQCVDLGGRRIIKKKKTNPPTQTKPH
eukprot:TRINITY_DN36935_c0_g1_i1.p2 TRINITY_DN36935_c0_g1~~TRINITY_DN36935_c0_g1_i1.p2  ORF type:complete len:118 (+),score=8.85 TRINITY_DN36935_c0_g1_i1:89-442(+)